VRALAQPPSPGTARAEHRDNLFAGEIHYIFAWRKVKDFIGMNTPFVDIHTHRVVSPPDIGIRSILLRETGQQFPLTESFSTGIHPWDADLPEERADNLLALLDTIPRPAAIGEIGLDHVREVSRARQEKLFVEQLRIAGRRELPVILHCVRAFERIMEILKKFRLEGVIFHNFTGSWQQASTALERGCYLSFGERGLRSAQVLEALSHTLPERIFLETDESETPIQEIYAIAAKHLKISTVELARIVCNNYKTLFT
jgi:TatD DNase family protein